MSEIFKKANIVVTTENKKEIDRVIHDMVGTKYKDCPGTWRQVKKSIAEDENKFALRLAEAWANRTRKHEASTT